MEIQWERERERMNCWQKQKYHEFFDDLSIFNNEFLVRVANSIWLNKTKWILWMANQSGKCNFISMLT